MRYTETCDLCWWADFNCLPWVLYPFYRGKYKYFFTVHCSFHVSVLYRLLIFFFFYNCLFLLLTFKDICTFYSSHFQKQACYFSFNAFERLTDIVVVRLQTAWIKNPTYNFPPLTLIVFDFDNINMTWGSVSFALKLVGIRELVKGPVTGFLAVSCSIGTSSL